MLVSLWAHAAPDQTAFWLESEHTGRVYGPFPFEDGTTVKVGKSSFSLEVDEAWRSSADLRSNATGRTYGPFDFCDGSAIVLYKARFIVRRSGRRCFEILKRGVYERGDDTNGFCLAVETNRIPAKKGTAFGLTYVVRGDNENGRAYTDVRVELPVHSKGPGARSGYSLDGDAVVGRPEVSVFVLENEDLVIPGVWSFHLRRQTWTTGGKTVNFSLFIPEEDAMIKALPEAVRGEVDALLYSPDPVRRAKATASLSNMHAAGAIPFLRRTVTDTTPLERTSYWQLPGHGTETTVGEEAAIALSRIGVAGIKALISVMEDEELGTARWAAVRGLADGRATYRPAAVDGLTYALLNRDCPSAKRVAAARALGRIGDPLAEEPLKAASGSPIKDVAEAAAESLEMISVKTSSTNIVEGTYDRHIDAWAGTLLSEDWPTAARVAAARALGRIGDPRAEEPLKAALKCPIKDVAEAAAESLEMISGRTFTPDIVGGILDDLNSPDRARKADVLRLLAEKPNKNSRVIEALITVLAGYSDDGPPRRNAVAALRKATGQDFGPHAARWQAWWEQNKRELTEKNGKHEVRVP